MSDIDTKLNDSFIHVPNNFYFNDVLTQVSRVKKKKKTGKFLVLEGSCPDRKISVILKKNGLNTRQIEVGGRHSESVHRKASLTLRHT